VFIKVHFLKIGEIDTVKEKYTADIFIQARWREKQLDYKVRNRQKKPNNPSVNIESLLIIYFYYCNSGFTDYIKLHV
jgi:outer membrane lipopolysaccharide assembly protein LptE/RlpB